MSNKMSFKLKSSNKRKPSSGSSSRSGTPTNSQSSMGGVSDKQQESSIDDPLLTDEIKSLQVKEEQLRELHPTSKPPPLKTTQVYIKDSTLSPKRASTRNVAVLHPLPPKVKPSKTKLLGSLKSGPRCDEDNVLISHSIIGTVEEFHESRLANRPTERSPFSTVPPVILPELPTKKDNKPQSDSVPCKDTNALANWERQMNKRKNLQEKIAKRIKTQTEALTMNQGDTYRRVQEERSFIDRAIPAIDSGKGYYVGSEFWRLQSTVGDDITGLKTTLTRTEKGQPPSPSFISWPNSGSDKNNIFKSWSRSQYLRKRKEELTSVVPEPPYPPDVTSLHVTGQTSLPHPLSSASLDSLGESSLSSVSDNEANDDDDIGDSLQSISLLGIHPDIVTPPIIGPALQINSQLLVWSGEEGGVTKGGLRETRILFEGGVHELTTNQVLLENCGTFVINFTWKLVPHVNPLGTSLDQQTQRFYFDTRGGVILPGKNQSLFFTFKSPNVGIYSETWQLLTKPVLSGGVPIIVTLKGIAFQPDLNQEKRQDIERQLNHEIAEAAAKRLVNQIVDNIQTPPKAHSPLPLILPEETEFLAKNPGVFYNYNIVQQLKAMYTGLHMLSAAEHETKTSGTVAATAATAAGVAGKKQVDDKSKKDKGGVAIGGAGGKDKKDSNKKVSGEETKHLESDSVSVDAVNIPPWDLSLDTLQKLILDIEDSDRREERLKQLNTLITSLCHPLPSVPRSTNYIKTYILLCEAVDSIVHTSENLRQVMGIPVRDLSSLQEEDSFAELDAPSQPSSPVIVPAQGSKKDQSKKGTRGKETGKEKETARPPSKKGTKGNSSTKKAANTKGKISKAPSLEHEPSKENNALTVKPSEIDPSLNEKYKQVFHSLAQSILASTVEQMSVMMTTPEHY